MRASETVEIAIHAMLLLAALNENEALSGGRLAEFHSLPPTTTAKAMQSLANAGLVGGRRGRGGGYFLSRDAEKIDLSEIVTAVAGNPGFRCSEIRQQGPCVKHGATYSAQCDVAAVFSEADDAWWSVMRSTTLADLAGRMMVQLSETEVQIATNWIDKQKNHR